MIKKFQEEIFNYQALDRHVENCGHQFHFINHGIPMTITSEHPEIIAELKNFYPKSWQINYSEKKVKIHWLSPKDVLRHSQWEDIIESDCFFHNIKKTNWVTQRDFVVKKINEFEYVLVCDPKIDDGLFNFMRYLLPQKLLAKNKILFHSSAVVDPANQQAYVFFGYSGAGKTTISQLCNDATVIGDDMNLISVENNKVFVEPALVGQRYFKKETFGKVYPVKSMFWLKQSTEISVESSDSTSTKLLSSFTGLFWDQLTHMEYEKVFVLTQKIAAALEIKDLQFNLNNEVWNYVRSFE